MCTSKLQLQHNLLNPVLDSYMSSNLNSYGTRVSNFDWGRLSRISQIYNDPVGGWRLQSNWFSRESSSSGNNYSCCQILTHTGAYKIYSNNVYSHIQVYTIYTHYSHIHVHTIFTHTYRCTHYILAHTGAHNIYFHLGNVQVLHKQVFPNSGPPPPK